MDHQEFQLGQRIRGSAKSLHRIRAHYVQRFQLAGGGRVHHDPGGQSRLGRNFAAPKFCEAIALGGVAQWHVARQTVRQHAHVRCAARIRVITQSHELGFAGELRAELDQIADGRTGDARAKDKYHVAFFSERFFQLAKPLGGRSVAGGEPAHDRRQTPDRRLHGLLRLALELYRSFVDDEKALLVLANSGANLPSDQRILLGGIVANQQHSIRIVDIGHGRQLFVGVWPECGGESGVIRGAVMINVVGAQSGASKAVQQIVLFVGGAIGADHAEGIRAALVAHLFQLVGDGFQRFFPTGRLEFAILAHQRLADALGVAGEVKAEAALGAKKLAVDSRIVSADLARRRLPGGREPPPG